MSVSLFLLHFSIIIVCLLLSSSVVPEKSDLLFIKVKNKTSPTDSCHSSDCDTDLENLDIQHRVVEACPKSKFAGLMVISWPKQQLSATKLTCIVYIIQSGPVIWQSVAPNQLHPKDVHVFSCFPCYVVPHLTSIFSCFPQWKPKGSYHWKRSESPRHPVPQLGIGGQHQVLE